MKEDNMVWIKGWHRMSRADKGWKGEQRGRMRIRIWEKVTQRMTEDTRGYRRMIDELSEWSVMKNILKIIIIRYQTGQKRMSEDNEDDGNDNEYE